MTGMSDKAKHEKAMHEQVAEMYRRREQYRFSVDFQRERNEILMSLTPTARDAVAVDLGCGTGITLLELSERYDQVIGVDLSHEMLEGFDPAKVPAGRSVAIAQADMIALPLASGSVDLVLCRSALHHMDDEVGVLREACRVLKDSGRLVLGEPANDNVITRLARWWVKRRPSYGTVHTIDRAYTQKQLRTLLDAADLEITREVRFGFIAYPLCDNPDLVPVLKWLPFSTAIGAALRAVDRGLSKVPLLRTQSWYTMLQVRRRAS